MDEWIFEKNSGIWQTELQYGITPIPLSNLNLQKTLKCEEIQDTFISLEFVCYMIIDNNNSYFKQSDLLLSNINDNDMFFNLNVIYAYGMIDENTGKMMQHNNNHRGLSDTFTIENMKDTILPTWVNMYIPPSFEMLMGDDLTNTSVITTNTPDVTTTSSTNTNELQTTLSGMDGMECGWQWEDTYSNFTYCSNEWYHTLFFFFWFFLVFLRHFDVFFLFVYVFFLLFF